MVVAIGGSPPCSCKGSSKPEAPDRPTDWVREWWYAGSRAQRKSSSGPPWCPNVCCAVATVGLQRVGHIREPLNQAVSRRRGLPSAAVLAYRFQRLVPPVIGQRRHMPMYPVPPAPTEPRPGGDPDLAQTSALVALVQRPGQWRRPRFASRRR